VPAYYWKLAAGTRSRGIGCRLPVHDTRPFKWNTFTNFAAWLCSNAAVYAVKRRV